MSASAERRRLPLRAVPSDRDDGHRAAANSVAEVVDLAEYRRPAASRTGRVGRSSDPSDPSDPSDLSDLSAEAAANRRPPSFATHRV